MHFEKINYIARSTFDSVNFGTLSSLLILKIQLSVIVISALAVQLPAAKCV